MKDREDDYIRSKFNLPGRYNNLTYMHSIKIASKMNFKKNDVTARRMRQTFHYGEDFNTPLSLLVSQADKTTQTSKNGSNFNTTNSLMVTYKIPH